MECDVTSDKPLWVPSPQQIATASMSDFMQAASAMARRELSSYAQLHDWSIAESERFWDLIWDYCGVVGEKGERVLVDGDKMPGAAFFPDAKLKDRKSVV